MLSVVSIQLYVKAYVYVRYVLIIFGGTEAH